MKALTCSARNTSPHNTFIFLQPLTPYAYALTVSYVIQVTTDVRMYVCTYVAARFVYHLCLFQVLLISVQTAQVRPVGLAAVLRGISFSRVRPHTYIGGIAQS